jgi:lipoprotein
MKKRILLLALLLLLTGCKDQDKCLSSHRERRVGTACHAIGKAVSCIPRVYYVSVCDEYEHGEFICTRKESE